MQNRKSNPYKQVKQVRMEIYTTLACWNLHNRTPTKISGVQIQIAQTR